MDRFKKLKKKMMVKIPYGGTEKIYLRRTHQQIPFDATFI